MTRQSFIDIEADLGRVFFERAEPIRGLVLAILARQNIFLLGPPGTAKSMLVDETAKRLGLTKFKLLMTRFTTPEEVLGPVSLPDLEQGRYVRVTSGMLPEALLAFLDEVFKANSAILNSLLTMMNEREYHCAGKAQKVPLISVVGASNELPQGEDLAALFDRFLLRFLVPPLAEEASLASLLSRRAASSAAPARVPEKDVIDAQAEVSAVDVPEPAVKAVLKVKADLVREGITASDRRWRDAMGALRAQAWLEGRSSVSEEDLGVLSHVLWGDPAQRRKVTDKVLTHASPTLRRAVELLDQAAEQQQLALTATEEAAKFEAAGKLRKLAEEIDKLAASNPSQPRVREAQAKIGALRKEVVSRLMS